MLLNTADLRANVARLTAGSGAGSLSGNLGNAELLRRLRETQALLIKFSEENSRLARDNDKLQAGRKVLSNEHANVLDEIDLLRGKLSQLEQSVLTAAAAGSSSGAVVKPAAASDLADSTEQAGLARTTDEPSFMQAKLTADLPKQLQHSAGLLDIQALLSSFGLGEEAVSSLTAVGEGPMGVQPLEGDSEFQIQHIFGTGGRCVI
jgi:uncharacterized phage infection (PIP) family protein YhgE